MVIWVKKLNTQVIAEPMVSNLYDRRNDGEGDVLCSYGPRKLGQCKLTIRPNYTKGSTHIHVRVRDHEWSNTPHEIPFISEYIDNCAVELPMRLMSNVARIDHSSWTERLCQKHQTEPL